MPVNLGSSAIANAYLGSISASKMYLGSALVYDGTASTLSAAIASSLPFAPSGRRSAIATAAQFADSSNPVGVINLLASARVLASAQLGDGCLYQDTTRTTEAATAGDVVASVWNWNNSNVFVSQSNTSFRGSATSSNGLSMVAGRALSGTPFNSSGTQIERVFVQKSSQDPSASGGQFEGFGTSQSDAETLSFGSFAPFTDGLFYDRFAFANTGPLTGQGTSRNPTVSLTSAFYTVRSSVTTTLRTTQINLETTATNSTTISTPVLSHYCLGSRSGFAHAMNFLFFIVFDSVLSAGDRTLVLRFLSNYFSLGLY